MDTSTIQLGVIPEWYYIFALSPFGIVIALAIVVGFGLLMSHKG